eukprot:m.250155 g.250155  ORF g.250155 m.250155 type:complete len:509 (+) comp19096_c0_seq3:4687-6213(+)
MRWTCALIVAVCVSAQAVAAPRHQPQLHNRASSLPPCQWVQRGANNARTYSCTASVSTTAFAESGTEVPLCTTTYTPGQTIPVCPSFAQSLTVSSLGVSGNYILSSWSAAGYSGDTYLVRNAPMLTDLSGRFLSTRFFGSFTWDTIGPPPPFLDDRQRMVWNTAWLQSKDDKITVVLPKNISHNLYCSDDKECIWTIRADKSYPSRGDFYYYTTIGRIHNDLLYFAESHRYPPGFGELVARNLTTSKEVARAPNTSTVAWSGSATIQLSRDGSTLFYISTYSFGQVAVFASDLSRKLYTFYLPGGSNGWRRTAMDDTLGIFYGWSYGSAGGLSDELFAFETTNGTLLWRQPLTPDGDYAMAAVEGVAVVCSSRPSRSYSPAHNWIRAFDPMTGRTLYNITAVPFIMNRLMVLSGGLLAVPWDPSTTPSSSKAQIVIFDAATGDKVHVCSDDRVWPTASTLSTTRTMVAVETNNTNSTEVVFLYGRTTVTSASGKKALVPVLGTLLCAL